MNGEISRALGQLAKVQKVLLSHNNFSGPLPDNLCNLRSAQRLDIRETDVTLDEDAWASLPSNLQALVNEDYQDLRMVPVPTL
jgi:hypothetical protein